MVTETSHTLISIRLNEREFHNVFDKYYVALCLFANQYTEDKALNELEHSKVVFEYAQKVIEKKKDSFFHDAVVEEETYRILAEAIDKLPDQMRAIMRLAMEGKKNAEIAEQLNVSVETVHTLKKIAYKKLRIYLKEYYYFLILFYL